MNGRTAATAVLLAMGVAASGPAWAQDQGQEAQQQGQQAGTRTQATAQFINSDGEQIGAASLTETPHGVLIAAEVTDLPPGRHAFHIHEVGECEPPDFESAGGHFNPAGKSHGFFNEQGFHAGDLPNIIVDEDGVLHTEVLATEVTMTEGDNALLGGDGTSLLLHMFPDDYQTDPAGASGPRIACAVIEGPSE
jgi:Cu-Zn family superoxide dismutase